MVKQFLVESDSDPDDDGPVFDSDDEEIDEDAAFTAEDYLKYGDVGSKRKVNFFFIHSANIHTVSHEI